MTSLLACGGMFAAASLPWLGHPAPRPVLAAEVPAPPAKRTEWVVTRDGTRLATDIYLPSGPGPFPVVLGRTPYNKDGATGMAQNATRRGYALVIQDTRGRFASAGDNLPFEGDDWTEARQDGYDTVEWIARQSWSNGKIGTFGGSAGAITQMGLAGRTPPHLVCQHLTVGSPSFFHDGVYPGGAFKKAMIEDWLRGTNHRADALQRWVAHPTYDDFWRERDLARRWKGVNVPAVHVGGWYDIFDQGVLDAFVGYQTKAGPKARGKQKLVMGPWTHGVLTRGAGEFTYPENAAAPPSRVHDMWRWFDHWLRGQESGVEREAAVTYYVMGDPLTPGAPGNTWRTADRWPVPAKETPYYLTANRELSTRLPTAEGSLSYRYDPSDPVPTAGGPHLTLPAGPRNQSAVESRKDVLVFTSEPLTAPLEVTGRVRARLWVSSDAPDTDFTAKLCDVYPDGRSFNVVDGILRARFRESPSREVFMKPGQVYRCDIDLWSTSIIFNKGHRLRVQIASSNAPGYDPNPNTGEPFRAGSATRVAQNTIHMDGKRPSQIVLPVVASP